MKILVVGSGGREHALVHALARSPRVARLYAAPGNGGTRDLAAPAPIPADQVADLAAFAAREAIDLTLVGPETPLSLGVVDLFRQRGLPIIGPTAALARLESSKGFTKRLCTAQSIPTAAYVECATAEEAYRVLETSAYPAVVKADGLAAGKGVVIAETPAQARQTVRDFMEAGVLGAAGARVVLEEFMRGVEASFHVFSDGVAFKPMVAARDHKRRFDGDAGPNTGGMGAYSTDDILSAEAERAAVERIVRPTLAAMDGYVGILYAGLMLTAEGPKLVEYNVRFGDPETQVILPRLETDLADVLTAMRDRRLGELELRWKPEAAVTVTLVAAGYPGKVETGREIFGLEAAAAVEGVTVYHAGTRWEEGRVYTAGGRVLNVTALGATLHAALDKAYAVAAMIDFEGKDYRRDIGQKEAKEMRA